jgi:hypothetical protein
VDENPTLIYSFSSEFTAAHGGTTAAAPVRVAAEKRFAQINSSLLTAHQKITAPGYIQPAAI